MNTIQTIDEYIKTFPEEIQEMLVLLRNVIKKVAPQSMETITYGMPTFKLKKNLVHFAAFKSHIGFYPTPSAILKFESELIPYKTSKGAIQFPLQKPLPIELIKRIVEFRVAELTTPVGKDSNSELGPKP